MKYRTSAPIRLGLMAPLTGLVELYGEEIVRAARIACDEVNASGGIDGQPLELVIEDDGSLPATALPAALRLVKQHGCVAMIGNLLSNSRIAIAAQVAEPLRIPYLNFSFYEGSITGRHFFNFAALPSQQIEHMIPYMARHFGPKMYFAGNNYEWPRGSIDAARRILHELGGEVLGETYLEIGADPDEIDQLLDEVARSGADVFAPWFAGKDQIELLTRFTAKGLKHRMAVVMGHYDEAMASRLPAEVREGFYSSNTYFMPLDTAVNRAVLARLSQQPGVDGLWPHGNGIMTNFGEGAYVCVHAFANAARAAGTTDTDALLDALARVRINSPQGEVVMDAATRHAAVNTHLARCNADGSFTIVEHFGRNPPRIPERYREQAHAPQLHESPASPAVTARIAAELDAARRHGGAAQHILSIADMAIIVSDSEGTIVESNQSACRMFGYDDGELLGLPVRLLIPPHLRQQHAQQLKRFITSDERARTMSGRSEITGYRKDGSFFPLEASIAKFQSDDGWLLVVTMRDVTDRHRAEERLARQATHDALTGLPNRALIRERMVNALQRSRRTGLSVAALFVDLDSFKSINDTCGHDAGDWLLQAAAQRLIRQVRPGDTVARLAGDEFIVFCEQVAQPETLSGLAERIVNSLSEPFGGDGDDTPLFVTASVGVAMGSGSTHSADDLLRNADTAMQAVKQHGGRGWQFFSASLQQQAAQRLAIINGLRSAIERDELSTRFQPIVIAESGRIVGAELLLRWHPAQGEVSPAVFIPIAELTGAIVPIGRWVFREGCLAEVAWRRRWGAHAPYVSVNVSARQLGEASLADEFAAILRDTGADPARLLLEITETSLMADVDANLRVLRRLAELGLRVAVDDFGTGYSSLSQLTRLPVDVLKIDQAFIDGIDKSPECRAVIRAVIGLGRALGLKLIAEGVENDAQQIELCAHGCDLIQGYHFHRPLAPDDFATVVGRELASDAPSAAAPLHLLIYVSDATAPMTQEGFDALLRQSRAYNRASGITGCLLHRDGHFMQLLEGRRESVLALMAHIRADTRHRNVRTVIEIPMRRRVFTDWSMALRDLDEGIDSTQFERWQQRRIGFRELAEDPRTCYAFITAHAHTRFDN